MWRSTINYGRKGLPLQAISAVDLALWDLLGKLRGEPVYALLGGKTKERLPVYMTTARPEIAKQQGFVWAKIPCPYGPHEGDDGFRKVPHPNREPKWAYTRCRTAPARRALAREPDCSLAALQNVEYFKAMRALVGEQ